MSSRVGRAWGNALGGWKRQGRSKGGQWGKKVSAVPYARVSTRSASTGVNAGAPLSKGFRISAGAYVRVERRGETAFEKNNRARYNNTLQKVAPHPALVEPMKGVIQKTINNRVFGKKYQVGSSLVSVGTSRSLAPSIKFEGGRKTNKIAPAKRASGITDFQNSMKARDAQRKARKAMNARPQRRNKNGKR